MIATLAIGQCERAMAGISNRYFEHRGRASNLAPGSLEQGIMQFGLFGSATARRPSASDAVDFDSSEGFRDWIDYNVAAEAMGFRSTFVVEHHFTGYGQVSATINLLTWLGARTRTLRLGTAVIVLPWHNPVLLAGQAAPLDLLSGGRL